VFLAYNFLTLIAAKSPTALAIKTIYASNLSYEGWDYVLSFYKIAGVMNKGLLHFQSIFFHFNIDGYMQKALDHRYMIYLLAALIIWAIIALVRAGLAIAKSDRSRSVILVITPAILLFLAISFYFPLDLKELVFIVTPYLLFAFYLLYQMRRQESYCYLKITLWWILSFALLLQFTGLPLSIKAPVLCSIYDLSLWSLLGIYLLSTEIKPKIMYLLVVVVVALLVCLPFYAHRMSEIVTPQNPVNISELTGNTINRDLYLISGTNSCNFNFDDGYKNIVYAAVIGCNLGNQSNHKGSMSKQFIKP